MLAGALKTRPEKTFWGARYRDRTGGPFGIVKGVGKTMGKAYFIHDADGRLWSVPDDHIFRDRQTTVHISAEFYRELRHEMTRFHSNVFLFNMPVSTHNIVCVGCREPNSERFGSMIWCVRFSLETGSTLFPITYGESFLWPLRKSTAISLHMEIRAREELQGIPDIEKSLLVTRFSPKYPRCGFSHERFNSCTLVTHLPDPRDRLFAMSVAPSTYESLKEANTSDAMDVDDTPDAANAANATNADVATEQFDFPPLAQTLDGEGKVNFPKCSEDVQYLIVRELVHTLLKQNNVAQLMKMRCISKSFCLLVDECARQILDTLSRRIAKAHRTHAVVDIHSARDAILAYNVSPVQLMFEIALSKSMHVKTGALSFVRFQLDKKPCEGVPTPAKHKAQRLVEVFKRNAAAGRRVKRPLYRKMHAR